ncbi:MAG: Rieske 2Fe-2S domain-containing protein [Proteobacteria bacterium]|nr:Rieske 2Fe-2S domain-containing protein [Pseudomonadota bacterium]
MTDDSRADPPRPTATAGADHQPPPAAPAPNCCCAEPRPLPAHDAPGVDRFSAEAWTTQILGRAREFAERVVLPTVLNEAKRPRHPLDIATRLAGLPFELAHQLRAARQGHARRRQASERQPQAAGGGFVFALHDTDLAEGERRVLQLAGQTVAIFRVADRFYATSNACPHAAGPVAEGDLSGTELTCPWHGWRFDLATGECLTVAGERLKTFAVKTVADQVLVRLV